MLHEAFCGCETPDRYCRLPEPQAEYRATILKGLLHKAGLEIKPEVDVTIGPIQHDNGMCQKTNCTCWCQACERHNWRHRQP